MPLSNPSQLLLRNDQLLGSNNPLVIGCPDSEFFDALLTIAPTASVNSYQVNFAHFQQTQSRYQDKVSCTFSEHYQNTSASKHDLVIFYFPKSKKEYQFMLAMLAPTLADDALILVVGENKSGVKSCDKLSKDFASSCNKIDSARHCSLFAITFNNNKQEFVLDNWFSHFDIDVAGINLHICSLPGVFSSGELDNGTRLLLENLTKHISGKVLDFGCGAGIIAAFVAKKYPQTTIDLIDVNALAIASAKKTLQLNQLSGQVFPSDGLSHVKGKYQAVISNPPFHQGIQTNYHATESFLKEIKHYLSHSGSLTIVANNFLKYAPIIKSAIAEPTLVCNRNGFAIHHCQNSK